jgi:quercetin dioxygenase-like cupin family protein
MMQIFKKAVPFMLGLALLQSGLAFAKTPPAPETVAAAIAKEPGAAFDVGTYNAKNVNHFTGDSYVANLTSEGPRTAAVTFYDGAHTYWHKHHGSCQILLATAGEGWYQIWGQPAHKLRPGEHVTIPEGVKHWHGAAQGHTFQHVAVMENKPGVSTEWLEEVKF